MSAAPAVQAIANVTALLGERFEPRLVDLRLADGRIAAIDAPTRAVRRSIEPGHALTPTLSQRERGYEAANLSEDYCSTAAASATAAPGAAGSAGAGWPANDAPAAAPDARHPLLDDAGVLDGTGLLAVPGFYDLHDHLRFLAPGLEMGEGLKLDDFLRVMWAQGQAMGAAEYSLGARLLALQRLKMGMTTVVDHCYTFHAPGLDEASLDGYATTGGRWYYARGIMTRPYAPVCETWDAAADKLRELVLRERRLPPERCFVAPVSIRQTRPEEFRKSRALADELGCGLYTHVSETAAEQAVWQQECGASPIRALDALGFLTPRTVLVHCVVLDDGEIDLLAERGCHVVHCPTNHMKLAKGFTRVPDLLAAGVNVAIGLDGSSDMLVELRSELGMHAAYRLDPNAVSKQQALQMATASGARAVGLGGRAGALAPGQLADVVLIDLRSLLQAPLLDPLYTLLYATHAGQIRHVLAEGRLVVADGRSTLVDEDALQAEATAIVADYLRRIDAPRGLWYTPDNSPLPSQGAGQNTASPAGQGS